LGWYGDTKKLKSFNILKHTPLNRKHKLLQAHPHGRLFYHTIKDKDFKVTEIKPKDIYSTERWSVVEVIRRIVGIILFPIIYPLFHLSRFLFGWEIEPPGIVQLWNQVQLSGLPILKA
jgi:hypothetical protein